MPQPLDVMIVFDVEDTITPADAGLEDMLVMLAEVMTAQQVTGSFFITGEKARLLRERGRVDALQAMAAHDIGSHTNMASIHPTVTERLETADWADGVARMAADELVGIDELSVLSGAPVRSFARHGGSYGPQLVAALGQRGLPFVYSPARLPGHNVTWYCNGLNIYFCSSTFQEAYRSRAAFDEAEKTFSAFAELHRDWDLVQLFQSHPAMIKTEQFWDTNYYAGLNTAPADWVVPDYCPDYDLATVRENWTRHCQHLHEDESIRLTTAGECAQRYGIQAVEADARELQALAEQAADSDVPFNTDRFSAAEILDLLARAYLAGDDRPAALPRRDVLGPSCMPLATPTARTLNAEALARAANGIVIAIDQTGMLPSRVRCGEGSPGSIGELGPGSILRALGQALTSHITVLSVLPGRPYPAAGETIATELRNGDFRNWPVHRKDLDMATLCRLSALQSWTLKPAWRDVPEC